ncbi:MAG: hypothetical protein ABSE68_01190 [Minisyncoccia bacterium]
MFGIKSSREKFLIIEELNGIYEITLAFCNLKKKKISVTRNFLIKDIRKLKRPFGGTDKIILLLNGVSATTAESIFKITRSKPDEKISESEADQLVYQVFWDFINRYRSIAAKKMNVNDLDLISVYTQVRDIALDFNRIFNPVGFKGPEISFRIKGTLTPRNFLPVLEKFKGWGKVFVFEKTSVLSGALGEFGSFRNGPGFLLQADENQAAAFRVEEKEQYPAGKLDWGTDSLVSGIVSELNVDKDTAQSLVQLYFRGEVSRKVGRWMSAKITESFSHLSNLFHNLEKKHKPNRAAFYCDFRLPVPVPPGWFKKIGGESVRIDEELERREFVLAGLFKSGGFNPLTHQNVLAALSLDHDLSKLDFINRLLRRRVKWLIPNF